MTRGRYSYSGPNKQSRPNLYQHSAPLVWALMFLRPFPSHSRRMVGALMCCILSTELTSACLHRTRLFHPHVQSRVTLPYLLPWKPIVAVLFTRQHTGSSVRWATRCGKGLQPDPRPGLLGPSLQSQTDSTFGWLNLWTGLAG